jgi:hypothetical protein
MSALGKNSKVSLSFNATDAHNKSIFITTLQHQKIILTIPGLEKRFGRCERDWSNMPARGADFDWNRACIDSNECQRLVIRTQINFLYVETKR